jgi:hypothetical protein
MAREKALAAAAHGRFMAFIMSRAPHADVSEQHTLKLIKEMQSAREQVMTALSE